MLAHLLAQLLGVHPQIARDLSDRPAALQRQAHASLDELVGVLLRTGHDVGTSSPDDQILVTRPPSNRACVTVAGPLGHPPNPIMWEGRRTPWWEDGTVTDLPRRRAWLFTDAPLASGEEPWWNMDRRYRCLECGTKWVDLRAETKELGLAACLACGGALEVLGDWLSGLPYGSLPVQAPPLHGWDESR